MMYGTNVGTRTRGAQISERLTHTWRWLAAALAVALAPVMAMAQVENVTPFYVVVERDGTPLQCRIGSASYPVKTLSASQVLKVDGQSTSMYRVEYVAGMNAFVKIDEVSLEDGGKTAKLTKPSRLMAANSEGGVSWWYLLDKELDAGQTFGVQKTVKGPDGKDAGYLVPAPAGSRAYIRRDAVRAATQAEVDTFLGKKTEETPAPAAPETKPVVTPPAEPPAVLPATGPGVTTIPVKPAPAPETAPSEPAKPEVAPVEAPKPEATTPPETTPTPPAAAPGKLKAIDAETLGSIYGEALRTPLEQVELDAVIAEFQRTIESLTAVEGTERLRRQLESRVQVLKMRALLQASLRETSASSGTLKAQVDQTKSELDRLEKQRQYTVVGRLVASSVYDGRRLPLMYRVLSPEPTSTRTLAYVAPDGKLDLSEKVGKIVGVRGDSRLDESLRVNIVAPTSVDVLIAVPSASQPVQPAPSSGEDDSK